MRRKVRKLASLGVAVALAAPGPACSSPTANPSDDAGATSTGAGGSTGPGGSTGTSTASSEAMTSSGTSIAAAADITTASGTTSGTVGAGGASSTSAGGSVGADTVGGIGGASGSASVAGGGSGGATNNGGSGGTGNSRPARVLLYSFSTLDISSVPAQLDILEDHLAGWSYDVDRSTDPAVFTDANLANYAAVGMINTCFSPFGANNATGEVEAQALQRFLQDGGGLFGTHCADVTFQSASPPVLYNQILGGRASNENFEGLSECSRTSEHPASVGLPETFTYDGNLDNTDFLADDIEVLVRCTWGNPAATDIVVSWVRNEGPGRVFFTNFGKVDTDLSNTTVGEPHIIAGLAWVLGL